MKAQYGILRFKKYKGPAISPIEAHNERTKEQYASNPDIDTDRSRYNLHLVQPQGKYREEADRMISAAHCRVRKDSVRVVEALVTASPEFFKGKTHSEIKAYFAYALKFLESRQRPDTFLSAVVHMDEKTPHLHLCFVPLTPDGRLSAKEIIGNRKNLVKWQDEFWQHMVKQYPELERGESASQTGREHIPPRIFKEMTQLTKQKEQYRLPVKYDPKAASPERWLTFLHELLDDADIPTLQEYLGYCLIPSTKGQKMMLIVGKGGEGKSRIGLVLKRLMGDAASNGSVQKIENNRFARADLERRLLMIDDDMDMNALPKTNYIKTIVTAEAKLDLERKGVQSYQRDIYARFLCFGNGALTSLYDHSDGFFRRQLILTTKDKPADRTDDPFLVEKMCAELEGILLWCLEGLHRLVQNNFRFTVSPKAAANVDTIKRSSNNVIDFMESEGYFRFKADYSISSKEFYDIYKQWCEDNACHSVSAIRFSAELRQNDRRYNLEATNNIYLPGGRRVRGFVGIEPLVHPCP